MNLGFNPQPVEKVSLKNTVTDVVKANSQQLSKDDISILQGVSSLLLALEKDADKNDKQRIQHFHRLILEQQQNFLLDYFKKNIDYSTLKQNIVNQIKNQLNELSNKEKDNNEKYVEKILALLKDAKIDKDGLLKIDIKDKLSKLIEKTVEKKEEAEKEEEKTKTEDKDESQDKKEENKNDIKDEQGTADNLINEINKQLDNSKDGKSIKTFRQKIKESYIKSSKTIATAIKTANEYKRKNSDTYLLRCLRVQLYKNKKLYKKRDNITSNITLKRIKKIFETIKEKGSFLSKLFSKFTKKYNDLIKKVSERIASVVAAVMNHKYTQKMIAFGKKMRDKISKIVYGVTNGIESLKKTFKVTKAIFLFPFKGIIGMFGVLHKRIAKTGIGAIFMSFLKLGGAYYVGFLLGKFYMKFIKPYIVPAFQFLMSTFRFVNKWVIKPMIKLINRFADAEKEQSELEGESDDLDGEGFLIKTLKAFKNIWESLFGKGGVIGNIANNLKSIINWLWNGKGFLHEALIGMIKNLGNILSACSGWMYRVVKHLPGYWKFVGMGVLFVFKLFGKMFSFKDKEDKFKLNPILSTRLREKPDKTKIDFSGNKQLEAKYDSMWESASYEEYLTRGTEGPLIKDIEEAYKILKDAQEYNFNSLPDLVNSIFKTYAFPGDPQDIDIPQGFASKTLDQQLEIIKDTLTQRNARASQIMKTLKSAHTTDVSKLLPLINNDNFSLSTAIKRRVVGRKTVLTQGTTYVYDEGTTERIEQESQSTKVLSQALKPGYEQANNLLQRATSTGVIKVDRGDVRKESSVATVQTNDILMANTANTMLKEKLSKLLLEKSYYSTILFNGVSDQKVKAKLKSDMAEYIKGLSEEKLYELNKDIESFDEFAAKAIEKIRNDNGLTEEIDKLEKIKYVLKGLFGKLERDYNVDDRAIEFANSLLDISKQNNIPIQKIDIQSAFTRYRNTQEKQREATLKKFMTRQGK